MKTFWKKYQLDGFMVVMFIAIAFAYFFVPVMQNKVLFRHDSSAGRGMGQEMIEYTERTGNKSLWTNSAFGGMPSYQIAPSYSSTKGLSQVEKAYHLWLPENVWFLFVYLLGFYILLRAFDFRQWMAALGAVIWAFSSYFLIIIAAGHLWKVMALAYLPPMIAGIVLAYRGKYLWGFILTAVFSAFEINANHVQMTYYYMFIIAFLVLAFLIDAIREHQLARFAKASAACAIAAMIGVSINLTNLYHTWQYQNESMRGKSELTKPNTANQTSSGLERDYITQWSYGVDETLTLLIPNAKGGASVPMIANKVVQENGDPMYESLYQQIGQYWGEQPGTSGPVYVGAFVMVLFILSLFVVRGPVKWALLAATILSVMLAWGKNFMPLTDFFIDHFPMYAKFRTVASILVIAEFTIPLLAMLALREVVRTVRSQNGQSQALSPERMRRYTLVSALLTAAVVVFCALFGGSLFNFVSSSELQGLSQIPEEQLRPLLDNLTSLRQQIFRGDCWRSLLVIAIGTVWLLFYQAKGKLKTSYMAAGLLVLCLIDLWQVDKRYLNDDMFVPKSERENPIEKTATDEQILQDSTLDYRVLNFASNTFNENETSYFHKSIGGYHAAKLRRYQELIERHIAPEMSATMQAVAQAQGNMSEVPGDTLFPVLNMLNTKYFIFPMQDGQTLPLENPYAFGNAWLIDKVTFVDNANQEIDAVGHIDLRHEAVADKKFSEQLGKAHESDTTAVVKLTKYEPNQLEYEISSEKGGVVVFSEIYYPGWTATVDGEEVPVARVDYVLRAINVKGGRHQVVLAFFPKSINVTETIAFTASALLLLAVIIAIVVTLRKSKK